LLSANLRAIGTPDPVASWGNHSELRHSFVERHELPEAQLRPRPRLPPVTIDHGARPVPRAVSTPGLAFAVGQADRHERGPQIVHTEWMPYGRPFKNLGPCHARPSEIVAQVLGHLVDIERPPGLAENMIVLSGTRLEAATPKLERSRHSRIQRRCAGIVGLVLVETHDPAAEIHVAPAQAGGFLSPHALTLDDPEE
jgi:hypothetical protein